MYMMYKKKCHIFRNLENMAEATGLEPATSTVTGWHSNQLSYASASLMMPLMYAIISIFQAGFRKKIQFFSDFTENLPVFRLNK